MLSNLLKLISPLFIFAGFLHLVLGLNADVLLGANLSIQAISDPALDSQNRFYGTTFTIYGVLLFLCSTDLQKYSTVLKCLLWVFWAAGFARLVSIAVYGVPPVAILVLTGTELLLPPVLLKLLSNELHRSKPSDTTHI